MGYQNVIERCFPRHALFDSLPTVGKYVIIRILYSVTECDTHAHASALLQYTHTHAHVCTQHNPTHTRLACKRITNATFILKRLSTRQKGHKIRGQTAIAMLGE